MKRTTVVLTDQQAALLELERRRQGISTAAIIREALDRYFGGGDEPQELWFVGLGESDGTESAADGDEVLAREWTYGRIMGLEEERSTTAEPVTTAGASATRRTGRHQR